MGAHEFSVPVRELDAAGKRLRLAVSASWMRSALEGTEVQPAGPEGELDVRLSKSGTDVVVRGTLAAELSVACARCLEPARIGVREPVSALVVLQRAADAKGARDGGERDWVADELDVIPYDGDTVVLDDLVRDELLLAVPMIPLCSEKCPGIRPQG